MSQDQGVTPSGSGHSAEPGPISVVPAETASVPNAATIAAIEAGERGEVTRFDPSCGDTEMLAILLWDFFGPQPPRRDGPSGIAASPCQVAAYRQCAADIASSLRFYRDIGFDADRKSA